MSGKAFRDLLEAGDITGLREAWAQLMPHLPQLETAEQAEIVMHRARTEADSLPIKHRAWSHRWLTERDLPSGLPDEIKPSAERLYPIIADAVGIAVKASNPVFKAAALEVRGAMEVAVEEAYADGRKEPEFVRQRMGEARAKTYKALFGI